MNYNSFNNKGVYTFLLFMLVGYAAQAQQGFGTSNPDKSSVIDLTATNKGALLPRVALTSTTDVATIAAPAHALTVFNTATAGDVTPGYYYYVLDAVTPANSKWLRLATNAWSTNGNSGTIAGTNFLGTTDAQNLVFKVNNEESGYIQRSTASTGSFDYKTSFGYNAGSAITTGDDNTLFGARAGATITTGSRNTAVGSRALSVNTITTNDNTAIGAFALAANTGSRNMAMGSNALVSNTTGSNNVAIGDMGLNLNTTGSQNTAVGQGSFAAMTSGDGNTALGALTSITATGLTNATAIGFKAIVEQSNSIVLGGIAGKNTGTDTQVGIGTTTPANKLHVKATADPLRLEGITNSATTADKVLVADANGVVKYALNSTSNFSGYISTTTPNIPSSSVTITKIPVDVELVDVANEFDNTAGNYTFKPVNSGTYEIELQINVESNAAGILQNYNTAPSGLVDATTGLYVTRWQLAETTTQATWFFKGVANLSNSTKYYFGFVKGSSASPTLNIVPNATGSTGSGKATYFSIKRVL